ncbi:MAG: Fmu (Sun) domain-containing protein [Desulfovibrionaceae bacterium]|nr:Fmu (Sun) domain-containing protein [Desulfovibrionaceae bacterium]
MSFSGLERRAGNDPRAAALLAAGLVIHGSAQAQAALETRLGRAQMPPVDKALATELFYGLLRHHLRLDWFLRQKLRRPEKLPQEFFLLLELSAYSLAHTRLPPHAAVNWAVDLAANRFSPGLGKLGNAFLRSFARAFPAEYLNPDFYAERLGLPAEAPETLGIFQACPAWLVRLWQESYGRDDCLALLAAGLKTPPQGLRLNPARPLSQDLQGAPIPPHALALPAGRRPPLRSLMEQGMASLQSPAAYATLFGLQPENWPLPIWDACAGQGGKTLALLEHGIPVHSAGDPHSTRLQRLPEEFSRLGLAEAGRVLPALFPKRAEECDFEKKFASILLDVPCSGLGTLARRPEIRWRRAPGDLDQLCRIQKDLLETAHLALIPNSGNRILYLTCTLNPAENQKQIQDFLQTRPQYRLHLEIQTPPGSPLGEFFYGAVLLVV